MSIQPDATLEQLRAYVQAAAARADEEQLRKVAAYFEVVSASDASDPAAAETDPDIPVPESLRRPSDEELAAELNARREQSGRTYSLEEAHAYALERLRG